VLVFYHGGGWVVGDLDTHDPVCRYLAKASQCCVISVNYRLAPEHPFPAAVIDSSAAFDWIVRNAATIGIDVDRIGVAGDSAGGFLATYVALERMIANEEVKPHVQVLFYPVTDLTAESEGYLRVMEGFSFTSVTMRWFRDHYVASSRSPSDTRLAPLLYLNLAGLPATFIVTSKHDPLCEEGVDYATRLEDVGVRVSHLHLGDQIHGFLTLGARIKVAESVLNLAGDYVHKELGRKET
jgi:acetyl esterase